MPTQACLCLTGSSLEADRRLIDEHRPFIDVAQLRVDCLTPPQAAAAASFARAAGLQVILTVRRARDGGRFSGSEAERIALLRGLMAGRFAFVDLEEDLVAPALETAARAAGSVIIRSFHDFTGVPPDLAARVRRLARRRDEIPMAAVMTRGVGDLEHILRACEALADTEKILFGMGEYGFASRVLASRLGSRICFTSATGAGAAEGQTDPRTLQEVYRFRDLDSGTAVYGVVGNPVMHSLSPVIHNRGLGQLGLNAVYLPFPVDDLAAFREVADLLDIRGLSVTVPFKQAIIPFLARRDALVEAVGACNTITTEAALNGAHRRLAWAGTNTDVEGFLQPLREALGGAIPRGLRATVIGAGGAARAVVHALASQGALVLVLNRTAERAHELARPYSAASAGLDERGAALALRSNDLVVQTTTAGMEPAAGMDPFPMYQFSGRELVYDLVYAPAMTGFLERARRAGCRIVQGRGMLLAQAGLQFRLFTGRDLPLDPVQPPTHEI